MNLFLNAKLPRSKNPDLQPYKQYTAVFAISFSVYEDANLALECDWPSGSEPFKPQWYKVCSIGLAFLVLSFRPFKIDRPTVKKSFDFA